MKGRILSELYVAGMLPLMELQRRCRIGVENPDKEYGKTFRNVFFELLNTRKIEIDFHGNIRICH